MLVAPAPVNPTVPVDLVNVPLTVNGELMPVMVKVFVPLASRVWEASMAAEAIFIEEPRVRVVLPLVEA